MNKSPLDCFVNEKNYHHLHVKTIHENTKLLKTTLQTKFWDMSDPNSNLNLL